MHKAGNRRDIVHAHRGRAHTRGNPVLQRLFFSVDPQTVGCEKLCLRDRKQNASLHGVQSRMQNAIGQKSARIRDHLHIALQKRIARHKIVGSDENYDSRHGTRDARLQGSINNRTGKTAYQQRGNSNEQETFAIHGNLPEYRASLRPGLHCVNSFRR